MSAFDLSPLKRAEHRRKGRDKRSACLSVASCAERALSEKHRAARRAAFYGRFLLVRFLFTRKKMNKMIHKIDTLQTKKHQPGSTRLSPRIGRTSPGPRPGEGEIDRNQMRTYSGGGVGADAALPTGKPGLADVGSGIVLGASNQNPFGRGGKRLFGVDKGHP